MRRFYRHPTTRYYFTLLLQSLSIIMPIFLFPFAFQISMTSGLILNAILVVAVVLRQWRNKITAPPPQFLKDGKIIDESDTSPEIVNLRKILKKYCEHLYLTMPTLIVLHEDDPLLGIGNNACAYERSQQNYIIFTPTLFSAIKENTLSLNYLRGVIAHELFHIKNRDKLMFFLSDVLVSINKSILIFSSLLTAVQFFLSVFSLYTLNTLFFPFLTLFCFLISDLSSFAFQRSCEAAADHGAIKLINDPSVFGLTEDALFEHQEKIEIATYFNLHKDPLIKFQEELSVDAFLDWPLIFLQRSDEEKNQIKELLKPFFLYLNSWTRDHDLEKVRIEDCLLQFSTEEISQSKNKASRK